MKRIGRMPKGGTGRNSNSFPQPPKLHKGACWVVQCHSSEVWPEGCMARPMIHKIGRFMARRFRFEVFVVSSVKGSATSTT